VGIGKRDPQVRAAGRVPAVLYGHGMEPISLSVDSRELVHLFHSGAGTNVLVGLEVDGKNHLAMAREIQRDHIKARFIHVDFLAVSRDQRITVAVPVRSLANPSASRPAASSSTTCGSSRSSRCPATCPRRSTPTSPRSRSACRCV
jgi:large subunit ribosomal protein L25